MITTEEIRETLFSMSDPGYRDFQSRLMPDIPKERIIGVRTPALRKYAAQICREDGIGLFLKSLPHTYYEENNLHAFLIEKDGNFEHTVAKLHQFLPYVDNWATCDSMSPKVLFKNREKLLPEIDVWLNSDAPFAVRFGIEMLMNGFLGENFKPEFAGRVAKIRREEYYIKMMQAWYFATALAKNYGEILPYLTERRLDAWVHEKTIRKAIESYRLTEEQKSEVRALSVRGKGSVEK